MASPHSSRTPGRPSRRRQLWILAAAALLALGAEALAGQGSVRAWQGELSLPSYQEGLPDPNPPFDFFQPARINYPYTIRNNLTDERRDRSWRALFLENEYLRCVVLPDLGGHLYSCTDKINGEEVFYANPSIKLTKIGYRGAWAAFGVEFNFPVSHNWVSTSPVDYAYREHEDGSASVWVGNVDRVFGTHWLVELKLRPGRAVLEQHTTLYNRSDFRHRFYWWTNAAVQVWDDSRVLYPMTHTASHGFRDIDTWPVDSRGTDLSVVGNHLFGPVSRFSHGSREPFMAVYHPRTDAGVVHYSSPVDLPSKKVWSFGGDDRGVDWREALSDDGSAYVEIQAGVFRNQETYGFLEPRQRLAFSEIWIPVRGLGGVTRANPEAVVHLGRTDDDVVAVVNVTGRHGLARVDLSQGGALLSEALGPMSPETAVTVRTPLARLPDPELPVTVTVWSGTEHVLLRHTEGQFDVDDDVSVGAVPQASPPAPDARTEGEWLTVGMEQELDGRRLEARQTYQDGLVRFPGSLPLTRALGRLDVALGRYPSAVELLRTATNRVTSDLESWYHLGHASLAIGDTAAAQSAWEKAQAFGVHRTASLFHLAALHSRMGRRGAAVDLLDEALQEGGHIRARVMRAALLRAAGRGEEARRDWAAALELDPTSSLGRFEATRQGRADEGLWSHLAGDPERILEVAVDYGRFGLWEDALALLSRGYPRGPEVVAEPGQPHPSGYPLLHYYRTFYESASGADPSASLARARESSLLYVFPNRPETEAVLEHALASDPDDSSARFLLGALALSRGRAADALANWEAVLEAGASIPSLHWVMGQAVLFSGGDPSRAAALFDAGVSREPENEGLYFALDDVLESLGRGADERSESLLRFPRPEAMSPDLVFTTARRLVEARRFDEAESLFRDRFFAREEGGTNPREVWLEVRLGRAEAEVEAERCPAARSIVEGLTGSVDGMSFTEAGLDDWLQRRQDLVERRDGVLRRCGSGEYGSAPARRG